MLHQVGFMAGRFIGSGIDETSFVAALALAIRRRRAFLPLD